MDISDSDICEFAFQESGHGLENVQIEFLKGVHNEADLPL
jgi:hypothetical protein